ncbi:MAG: hypothetical protein HYZ37_00655 [Candidatus Solibacter usitatus]|nr:hypothetical protein [Candidatus Solibacter usitatus]
MTRRAWLCSLSSLVLPAQTTLTEEQRSQFLEQPFEKDFGSTTEEIVGVLGQPLERKTAPRKNLHMPGQLDEIITLIYPGLEFAVYRTRPADGSSMELHLRTALLDNRFKVKFGLGIGASLDTVRRRLGKPAQEQPGLLIYEANDFQSVAFTHRNGLVSRVERRTTPD